MSATGRILLHEWCARISEKLLRCKETAEFVSYSESESEVAIEAYRNSEAQKEIVQHACALKWAKRAVRGGVSKRSP
jgi:heme-degrading monooxygenase HmoA